MFEEFGKLLNAFKAINLANKYNKQKVKVLALYRESQKYLDTFKFKLV